MDQSWFDPATGTLRLDEMVMERPSFRAILDDGEVTPTEMREQAERVAESLRRLESLLSPEAKGVATDALCELAVLYGLTARTRTPATETAR